MNNSNDNNKNNNDDDNKSSKSAHKRALEANETRSACTLSVQIKHGDRSGKWLHMAYGATCASGTHLRFAQRNLMLIWALCQSCRIDRACCKYTLPTKMIADRSPDHSRGDAPRSSQRYKENRVKTTNL
eukprot:5671223-Amphidinium_carterae.1